MSSTNHCTSPVNGNGWEDVSEVFLCMDGLYSFAPPETCVAASAQHALLERESFNKMRHSIDEA